MPQYKPSTVFGFAVNGLLIFTSIWTMVYGHKYSFATRICGGYIITAVLMIILPLVTNAFESGEAFAADLVVLTFFGLVGGVIQSSTFALGGILPGKYMGAIMFGNGISGISLNLVRAICLIAIPNDVFEGAMTYFILAALILLVCAFAQWRFQQLEFVKYYIALANEEKDKTQRRISSVVDRPTSSQSNGNGEQTINKSEIRPENRISDNSAGNYPPIMTESVNHNVMPGPKVSPLKTFFIMMRNSFLVAW